MKGVKKHMIGTQEFRTDGHQYADDFDPKMVQLVNENGVPDNTHVRAWAGEELSFQVGLRAQPEGYTGSRAEAEVARIAVYCKDPEGFILEVAQLAVENGIFFDHALAQEEARIILELIGSDHQVSGAENIVTTKS